MQAKPKPKNGKRKTEEESKNDSRRISFKRKKIGEEK